MITMLVICVLLALWGSSRNVAGGIDAVKGNDVDVEKNTFWLWIMLFAGIGAIGLILLGGAA